MATMLTMPAIIRLNWLPNLGETDGVKGDLPAVVFTMGKATWVIWEYDPKQRLGFGLCDLGMGFPELGYVSLDEVCDTSNSVGIDLFCEFEIETRFAGYKYLSLEIPVWLVT
jgi:hypothetical protein